VFLTGHGVALSVPGSGAEAPRVAGISLLNSNRSPVARASSRCLGVPATSSQRPGQVAQRCEPLRRVRYDAVYPGIDVVYYGNQNQLEYDFILHPGADPGRIRLKFKARAV